MKKATVWRVISFICFGLAFAIVWLQLIPRPYYKVPIFVIAIVLGIIADIIYRKINHIKVNPFYDPDKKKHFRNWAVFILSLVATVVVVSFVYWKFFL